ncbi:glutamine synthetase [Tistlia consotensis]|uniref:Glutamine synthetase n=1 Tax=Tistlia consotensis USBA 355 TaxID=560819 RepID=A0A1Y6C9T1_9PROT|nr:glutamine synthetase family protein [Tistlia consotensis]SMF52109.1 glutamine synthetase [Tistlia consotensis USBA 355]SNR83342.1 glutamine synthetase [Tistlia consotensis]
MHREAYVMLCYSDFAGQLRGKGFPARELERRLGSGIGLAPTNYMINCFGEIPATPWGAAGEVLLRPVASTEARVDFGDGGVEEHFLIGEVETLAGDPWDCCPRQYLKAALAELEERHGLRLRVAFEHEFMALDAPTRFGASYGLDAVRRLGELPHALLHALRVAGLEPDTFLPEYGTGQFEVTIAPALGLAAADRAAILRQLIQATAWRCGVTVSLSPKVRPDVVGNGVHIHFSLEDREGRPLSHDPALPEGVSAVAGHFLGGLLAHARALSAVAAPSGASYLRLTPGTWSASHANLGLRDREATLRICPVSEKPGAEIAGAFNFEYRAADAAASPYLVLGALVRAGLAGLDAKTPRPDSITAKEIAALPPDRIAALGLEPLPRSLGEALDCLEADRVLMPEALKSAYLLHKRGELARLEGLSPAEVCALYAQVY